MKTIQVKTNQKNEYIDVSTQVKKIISESNIVSGIAVVFCPHTTAALTINENADPDVTRDIELHMSELVPNRNDFAHLEGNSDGHIKSSLFGPSLTLIVEEGRPVLGTWQGIYFCEFDGPRSRKVHVKVITS